jgi:hypothetical protein
MGGAEPPGSVPGAKPAGRSGPLLNLATYAVSAAAGEPTEGAERAGASAGAARRAKAAAEVKPTRLPRIERVDGHEEEAGPSDLRKRNGGAASESSREGCAAQRPRPAGLEGGHSMWRDMALLGGIASATGDYGLDAVAT